MYSPEILCRYLSTKLLNMSLKTSLFLGVVCSLHFSPHCIVEKSYAQQVASYSPKCLRKLKPDAIPMTLVFSLVLVLIC